MAPRVPCLSKVVPDLPITAPAFSVLGFERWLALRHDPPLEQGRGTEGGAVHRGGSMRANRGLSALVSMPRRPLLVQPKTDKKVLSEEYSFCNLPHDLRLNKVWWLKIELS